MGPWLIKALNLVLLGASCYLAAHVLTEVGAEALEPPPIQPEAQRVSSPTQTLPADPDAILARNLFGAQLAGETPADGAEETDSGLEDLEATQLPLKLLGTAASTDPERSRASIEDTKNRTNLVVAIGDRVEGHKRVRVKNIDRRRVVLDNAGKLEELALDENGDGPAMPRQRARRPSRSPRRNATASRETLNDRLAKLNGQDGQGLSKILSSARIVPHYGEDGQMAGMKVDAIKSDSLLQKVGLLNGDVITEVNGISVDRLDATGAIFEELSSAEEIDVAATRNGQTVFLTADAEEITDTE